VKANNWDLSSGKLILVELVRPDLARNGFVVGLLPGWWLGGEDGRTWSPLITVSKWDENLKNNGFSGTDIVFRDYNNDTCHEISIMISTAVPPVEKTTSQHQRVFIRPDNCCSDINGFYSLLSQSGVDPHGTKQALTLKDAALMSNISSKTFIFLLELQNPILRNLTQDNFMNLQNIIKTAKGIVWITRGGSSGADPDFRMVDGLARVIRRENNTMSFITVAFDTKENLSKHQAEILCTILDRHDFEHGGLEYEGDFVEREGLLEVGRIVANVGLSQEIAGHSLPPRPKTQKIATAPPLKMKIETPGVLESIYFAEDTVYSTPLPDDEIEVSAFCDMYDSSKTDTLRNRFVSKPVVLHFAIV
jgi:hypothetical protein